MAILVKISFPPLFLYVPFTCITIVSYIQNYGTACMTTAYHAGSRCAKRDWNAFFASWLSGTANWQNLKTNILISEQILCIQNFRLKKEHFNLFDTAAVRFISGHHLALIFHLRKISCWQLLDYDRLSDLEILRFRNISQFDLNRLSDLLLNLSTRERPNVDGLWTW